jgi:N,N'-diacetyllegionaminate synthase
MTAHLAGYLERADARGYPVIVAEIGAKYAPIEVMKKMIRAAHDCGADLVKFQTYRAENIAVENSFFTFDDGRRVSQFEFFKAHELSPEDHRELIAFCHDVGIGWLSTPSHPTDVELLEPFDPIGYKVGSDDLTNLPLLRYICAKRRPIIASTGMSTLHEVEQAVRAIQAASTEALVLLHCTVSYPSKPDDANLKAIDTMRQAFGVPVGLSDHTRDEFTSILATQMGAVMIEKHLTLDHAMKLPDHEASLDPVEFRNFVERVALVPKALGDGIKRVLEAEKNWRAAARKSLYSATDIRKGQVIEPEHLAAKRPGDGIGPELAEQFIGRRALRDIPRGTRLTWDLV